MIITVRYVMEREGDVDGCLHCPSSVGIKYIYFRSMGMASAVLLNVLKFQTQSTETLMYSLIQNYCVPAPKFDKFTLNKYVYEVLIALNIF